MFKYMDSMIKDYFLEKVTQLLKEGFTLNQAFEEIQVPKPDREYITRLLNKG